MFELDPLKFIQLHASYPLPMILFYIAIIGSVYIFGFDNLNELIKSYFNISKQFPFHFIVIGILLAPLGYSIYSLVDYKSYDIPSPVFNCSLKDSYQCNDKNTVLPIVKNNIPHTNMFTKDGFKISKDTAYLVGFSENLPTGLSSKTATLWFKFDELPTFKGARDTAFLFSYGATNQVHNKAFGLQIGIPEIRSAQKANFREHSYGLRVFTYCQQGKKTNELGKCDYLALGDEVIKKETWYFVSLVYDSSVKRFKVYFGENGQKELSESGYIGDAERDEIEVAQTNYIYIGNIVSEFPYFSMLPAIARDENGNNYSLISEKGADYIAFSTDKWIFNGYIREVSIYDKALKKDEITHLFQKTKI